MMRFPPPSRGSSAPAFTLSLTLFALCATASAAPMNLAPSGTATASSEGFGAVASDGNDGDRNGAFGAGSVFHTVDPDTAAFYQVDLGDSFYLDRLQILPRTDARQSSVENFRVRVLADDGSGNPGAEVFNRTYLPANAANFTFGTTDLGTATPGGTRGRFVRLERLDSTPDFLTFAEFEVYGQPTPLVPSNIAVGKPATASPPGFGASVGDGNDGDIDGDFYHPGFPVYHSAVAAPGQFYQVDLGGTFDIDYIELFDRGDFDNTTQFLVSVLDESSAEVYSTTVDSTGLLQYDHTLDLTDVSGRFVRVETTGQEFLVLSELRVFAVPEPGAAAALLFCALPLMARCRRFSRGG